MRGTKRQGTIALSMLAAIGIGGCTAGGSAPAQDRVASGDELVATMEVEAGDPVRLTLHVTNPTTAPVRLEFTSGQRYDFAVARVDGEQLWRWSAARSFMQALGSETLPPGGSLRYTAEWSAGGQQGEFVATGEVTATNRRVTQSARFELAGDE